LGGAGPSRLAPSAGPSLRGEGYSLPTPSLAHKKAFWIRHSVSPRIPARRTPLARRTDGLDVLSVTSSETRPTHALTDVSTSCHISNSTIDYKHGKNAAQLASQPRKSEHRQLRRTGQCDLRSSRPSRRFYEITRRRTFHLSDARALRRFATTYASQARLHIQTSCHAASE